MVFEALLGASVGSGAAIVAAFVAQRYNHVLRVREAHHADLNQVVLRPWIKEIERQQSFVRPGGLGRYVWADLDPEPGFRFRTGLVGIQSEFPPDVPLWEQAAIHWPRHRARWEGLVRELDAVDRKVLAVAKELTGQLLDPPRDWKFQMESENIPGMGKRVAAALVFQKYGESQGETDRRAYVVEWLEKAHPLWDHVGTREQMDALHGSALDVLFEGKRAALAEIEADSARIHCDLQGLKQDILPLVHDRNLAGTCDYCPRFRGRRFRFGLT